ncbi:MAG: hypothetical protein B0A82_18855 [Alkalinema sp. CACIAM 70d]|nr:MAG: hypothetical protein B0A82_18855 [Alkalinema sp. CACIAM 70d]
MEAQNREIKTVKRFRLGATQSIGQLNMTEIAKDEDVTCPHCSKSLTTDIWFSRKQLARRWGIASKTLHNWGSSDKGPRFEHLNGVIRYHIQVIARAEGKKPDENA